MLAPAAIADQRDPRLGGPLQAMYQQAAMQGQAGAPAGCQPQRQQRLNDQQHQRFRERLRR
jgi:hypothetical protein